MIIAHSYPIHVTIHDGNIWDYQPFGIFGGEIIGMVNDAKKVDWHLACLYIYRYVYVYGNRDMVIRITIYYVIGTFELN